MSVLLIAVVAMVLSFVLFRREILWFSWIGIVAVGVSWHIVLETRHMRMQH